MPDIKVSWLAFDTASTPVDVKVSWLAFDTVASPVDVKVSWLAFDTAATTSTKSGVNRLWLIDYYTKAFAEQEKLRHPQAPKSKRTAKKRQSEITAKIDAAVAKAERDLDLLTNSVNNIQSVQTFIYNSIQQAQIRLAAEPIDFLAIAEQYRKKLSQEEDELLLLAMIL